MEKNNRAHRILEWWKENWKYIIYTYLFWFGINAFLFWLLLIKLDVSFYDNYLRGAVAGGSAILLFNKTFEDYPE